MANETKVSDNLQSFKDRLKSLRGEKSLQEVSQDLGISRATLGYYENGDRKPDIEILIKIANYYKVSSDYLLGLTNVTSTEIEDRMISEKTGLCEDSLQALYKLKNSTHYDLSLEIATLNFLLADENNLLRLLTLYLFADFESACEVSLSPEDATGELSDFKIPLTQLGLFDSQLNTVSIHLNKDFFLNAYLLDIQKELISLRQFVKDVYEDIPNSKEFKKLQIKLSKLKKDQ